MSRPSTPSSRAPQTPPAPRGPRSAIHAFFVLAVTVAGCMFVYKLFAFLTTIRKDELAGFAFDPIVIYGIVAMGFLFLLAWAYLTGQFRDVERAKHEMLERFDEQERAEGLPFSRKGDPA
jgi:hypothetical protein